LTPWQKIAARFGSGRGLQSDLARIVGKNRSSVSRYLTSPDGLIDGKHMPLLIQAAKERGIHIEAGDFVPDEIYQVGRAKRFAGRR
jgi:hypothetical protein